MKKTRFTESQIVTMLKEAEASLSVFELCRKHGISDGQASNALAGFLK